SDLTFGGWDIFKDNAYQSAANAGVLNPLDLEKVKPFLSTIKPMKAAFDHDFVKMIDGPNIKKGKNKYEMALQIKEDIANFRQASRRACWGWKAGSLPTSSATATAKFLRTRVPSKPRKSPSSASWNTFFSHSSTRSFTARCATKCGSTTTRRAATTKKAGTTLTSLAGLATRCKSRWTSYAAIPF